MSTRSSSLTACLKASKPAPLRNGVRTARRAGLATLANFRVPDVKNEPNVRCPVQSFQLNVWTDLIQPSYAKGTPERQKLLDAIKSLKQKAPLDVPAVVGGKFVSVECRVFVSAKNRIPLTVISDHKQHEALTSRPLGSPDQSGLILQRICCRCLRCHRFCARRKAILGKPAICRPCSSLPEGCRLGQHKVPLRHYGSHDAGPGKERLPGRDRFRCRAL